MKECSKKMGEIMIKKLHIPTQTLGMRREIERYNAMN